MSDSDLGAARADLVRRVAEGLLPTAVEGGRMPAHLEIHLHRVLPAVRRLCADRSDFRAWWHWLVGTTGNEAIAREVGSRSEVLASMGETWDDAACRRMVALIAWEARRLLAGPG